VTTCPDGRARRQPNRRPGPPVHRGPRGPPRLRERVGAHPRVHARQPVGEGRRQRPDLLGRPRRRPGDDHRQPDAPRQPDEHRPDDEEQPGVAGRPEGPLRRGDPTRPTPRSGVRALLARAADEAPVPARAVVPRGLRHGVPEDDVGPERRRADDGHGARGNGPVIADSYGRPLTPDRLRAVAPQLDDTQRGQVNDLLEERAVTLGDVTVQLKTPFEVVVDPLATDEGLATAEYICEEALYSPAYLREQFDLRRAARGGRQLRRRRARGPLPRPERLPGAVT
jgi:hypothetical protein